MSDEIGCVSVGCSVMADSRVLEEVKAMVLLSSHSCPSEQSGDEQRWTQTSRAGRTTVKYPRHINRLV